MRLANVLFLDGFRAAPGWMALLTFLLVLGSITTTCYPLGYRMLIDGALRGSVAQSVSGVCVVGGLLALGWLLTTIGATDAMALSDRIAVFRSAQLVKLISGIPGMAHLERPDYLSRVEQLNSGRRQLAGAPRVVLSNTSSLARIVTLLVLLATVSTWLLLLPLVALAPLIAQRLSRRIDKKADDQTADLRRLASMLFALTTDTGAAGELRSYGLSGYLRAEHARCVQTLNRAGTRQALVVLAVQAGGWLLYAAGLMGEVSFVAVRASDGAMSLGTALMAVSLIRRSRTQLASAANSSSSLLSALTTADRLFWLQDHAQQSNAEYGSQPVPQQSVTGGITFDDVSFRYPGTENTVLEHLDVRLPWGSVVAIVGENGSGKTTLVKLLLGMYQPTSGQIRIDDTPLTQIDPQAWRACTTAAFQDFSRLHMPILHGIGVADVQRIDDEPAAATAAARAGAAGTFDGFSKGLHTRVGTAYTGGRPLSGGQWQKVALARAMRRAQPLVMVLDEPTASLDAHAEHALFENYTAAARESSDNAGTITVLVSHRLSTVLMADLIIYLEHGRVLEHGTHQQLIDSGGRYAELFEIQAAGYR